MISFDEAVRRMSEVSHPLGSESVPIERAAGRVLSAPVIARLDSPPCHVSAMDGYAVRNADLPGTLRVVGESYAGAGFEGGIGEGGCVRIFTGAPVPEGADRVIIQEIVTCEADWASVPGESGPERHVRLRGSDFCAGQELLQPGETLTPRALVAAAGADAAEVEVWRRPRLTVLATGDELVKPGEAHGRLGKIPESVSYGAVALAEQWGGETVAIRRVGDDLPALQRAADQALGQADLVVVTGGASVGERDFAKPMFEPHGLELVFSKIAIKPGKPVWLGRACGRLVLGLPGNPTSAMVTARLLLAPLVARLCGRSGVLDWGEVRLAGPLPRCGDRETFVRARRTPEGAAPISNQDSSAQRALAEADLLLRMRPNDPPRNAGDSIEGLSF